MQKTNEVTGETTFLTYAINAEFSWENWNLLADELHDRCLKFGYEKILLDFRGLYERISFNPDIFHYLMLIGWPLTIKKTAVLLEYCSDKMAAFCETICRNRGINLKIFLAAEKAIEWLEGQSD